MLYFSMAETRHQITPASYLTLIKDGEILLLRRFNTGYEDGKYSMIAGHVDPGETFSQCIIREAKEEAGIDVEEKDLKVLHVLHRKSDEEVYKERVDIFFGAEKWSGELKNMEPHKCDDLSWFKLAETPENCIDYIKHVIDQIHRGNHYSEYGWN